MIELREFTRSDIPGMVAVQQALTKKKVPGAWTHMVERHLDDNQGVGFVAVQDGKVIGFVIGELKGEAFGLRQSGWIEVMGVSPQVMGEGIGKAMIDKLFEHFRKKKIKSVHTTLPWDSVDMISFFKSAGFGRSDFINLTRKL